MSDPPQTQHSSSSPWRRPPTTTRDATVDGPRRPAPRRGLTARSSASTVGARRHVHPRGGRPAARALAPLPPAHTRSGDRPGQADRARRPARQGTARQLQPAARRLQRPPLPEPGPAARRPRPGGHARTDPGEREVRLAQGLPLLHLRHPVDPSGDPARPGELGPHDPPARPRGPALAQGRTRRARAVGAPGPRADARGARRGDRTADRAGRGGPPPARRPRQPRPADRRGRRHRARRPAPLRR